MTRTTPGGRSRRPRTVTQSLCSIVLGFESIIVLLAGLVLFGLKSLPPAVALGGGGALFIAMLATIPLLARPWGVWVGWFLQAVVLASAVVNGAMAVVGVIFIALWAYCFVMGRRIDREKGTA